MGGNLANTKSPENLSYLLFLAPRWLELALITWMSDPKIFFTFFFLFTRKKDAHVIRISSYRLDVILADYLSPIPNHLRISLLIYLKGKKPLKCLELENWLMLPKEVG